MAFITASNPPPLQTRSPRARARVIGIPRGRWRENIYFSLGKKTPPRFPPKGGGAKLICKLVSIPSSSSRTLFPGAGGQTDTPMFYIRLEMVINGGKLWSLFFLARIRSIKQRGGGRVLLSTLCARKVWGKQQNRISIEERERERRREREREREREEEEE